VLVIIDYNMGNVASIQNILKRCNHQSIISNDPKVIEEADKLILPGVGSFDYGISNLEKLGIAEVLKKKVLIDKIPLLGICLGMQLLADSSEEGSLKGLGFIKAQSKKFEFNGQRNLKVPHMGWNYVEAQKNTPLFNNAYEEMRFYFVHSYFVQCENDNDILGTTNYGHTFTSMINKDNIYGFQFHPEKSHKYGMLLLKNFVELI